MQGIGFSRISGCVARAPVSTTGSAPTAVANGSKGSWPPHPITSRCLKCFIGHFERQHFFALLFKHLLAHGFVLLGLMIASARAPVSTRGSAPSPLTAEKPTMGRTHADRSRRPPQFITTYCLQGFIRHFERQHLFALFKHLLVHDLVLLCRGLRLHGVQHLPGSVDILVSPTGW